MQYNEIKDIYSFSAIHFNLLKIFLVICTILSPTSLYIARSGTIPQLSDHDPLIKPSSFHKFYSLVAKLFNNFFLKNKSSLAIRKGQLFTAEKVNKNLPTQVLCMLIFNIEPNHLLPLLSRIKIIKRLYLQNKKHRGQKNFGAWFIKGTVLKLSKLFTFMNYPIIFI